MSEGDLRLEESHAQTIQRHTSEEGRRCRERVDRRANIVQEAGLSELCGSTTPAGRMSGLQNDNRSPRSSQSCRGSEAIGPRSYYDGIKLASHSGDSLARSFFLNGAASTLFPEVCRDIGKGFAPELVLFGVTAHLSLIVIVTESSKHRKSLC
jgi:hypothetical protein